LYEIRPESVKTFIEDPRIKLPRFQRKQTWDEKKNFKLCISLFNKYPIGVSVIDHSQSGTGNVKYLLDGRQRRNALKLMIEDPEKIYDWAKKFIGFKTNDSEDEVQTQFWSAIYEHLEMEELDEKNSFQQYQEDDSEPNEGSNENLYDSTLDVNYHSINPSIQKPSHFNNLMPLCRIIKSIHKRNNTGSGFTRPFNFCKFINHLPYVDNSNGSNFISSRKLKIFIKDFLTYIQTENLSDGTTWSEEHFIAFLTSRYTIDDVNRVPLENMIAQTWETLSQNIQIVYDIENLFIESVIGIIELKHSKASDSQNIFKLINSEGTQLTAEEILSAKPSWNKKIDNPSNRLVSEVTNLYNTMGIKLESNDIVRWDFPATLLGRLDCVEFIFKKLSYDTLGGDFNKKITLGFKLLSGIYQGKITKDEVSKLATRNQQLWEQDLDTIIFDLNNMGKILLGHPFFKFFNSWKKSLMEITSNSVALNFALLTYLDWDKKGKPLGGTAVTTTQFQKNSIILFDKLIFEYVNKQWRGSSDSKIAENILSIKSLPHPLLVAVEESRWISLIEEIIDQNTINGNTYNYNLLEPILFHYYCLDSVAGPNHPVVEKIDIDHIIPQAVFDASTKGELKDNLFNLALLPAGENKSKGKKKLQDIHDTWLIQQIEKYENIKQQDFVKYSDLSHLDDLKETRKQKFIEVFSEKRNQIIN